MNIYDKKYQVFISSTYKDLIKAREEVIKVILSLYQIPIGMEMFSADNEEQWSVIKSTIDNSDYYLLIIGHRYGSLTKENISYTEKEFDYAKSIGVPIISFVKNRDIATTPNERDTDSNKHVLLEQFLNKVLSNSICDFWANENELGQKVAISLTKMFFKTPRLGWIKSDKSNSLETAEELTKLIQENRELREELIKLKSLNRNERPILNVQLNGQEDIKLKYEKVRMLQYSKITKKQITDDLLQYVSKDYIEKYNKEVEEKKEEIAEYYQQLSFFENAKNNFTEIEINITNNGKIKANDLYIDIAFPREIILLEKDDIEDLKEPKSPNISENPLYRVLRLKTKQTIEDKYLNAFENRIVSMPSISKKFLKQINVNRNFWINKEKNILTIKLNKLTHTRNATIKDDIVLVPLLTGTFEYEINIICDEYESNDVITHKIIVE